jgi:hypothetical protein
MAAKNIDAGLQQIADLERAIIAAHDQKAELGVSAEEVARLRPDVVRLAKTVADQLRAEYRARTRLR